MCLASAPAKPGPSNAWKGYDRHESAFQSLNTLAILLVQKATGYQVVQKKNRRTNVTLRRISETAVVNGQLSRTWGSNIRASRVTPHHHFWYLCISLNI